MFRYTINLPAAGTTARTHRPNSLVARTANTRLVDVSPAADTTTDECARGHALAPGSVREPDLAVDPEAELRGRRRPPVQADRARRVVGVARDAAHAKSLHPVRPRPVHARIGAVAPHTNAERRRAVAGRRRTEHPGVLVFAGSRPSGATRSTRRRRPYQRSFPSARTPRYRRWHAGESPRTVCGGRDARSRASDVVDVLDDVVGICGGDHRRHRGRCGECPAHRPPQPGLPGASAAPLRWCPCPLLPRRRKPLRVRRIVRHSETLRRTSVQTSATGDGRAACSSYQAAPSHPFTSGSNR